MSEKNEITSRAKETIIQMIKENQPTEKIVKRYKGR